MDYCDTIQVVHGKRQVIILRASTIIFQNLELHIWPKLLLPAVSLKSLKHRINLFGGEKPFVRIPFYQGNGNEQIQYSVKYSGLTGKDKKPVPPQNIYCL